MRKPNFFIVGAPKSGTTAMNQYLSEHPDIFMARKEMHHFGADLQIRPADRRVQTEEKYLQAFQDADDTQITGEASVYYLFSQCAAEEIYTFNPDARIIIMLRNPIDMLYSLYAQFRYNGNEDLPSFEEALDAETERKHGYQIPSTAHNLSVLAYREMGMYCKQVKRYIDLFGRERVQVILFDDFKEDTPAVYKTVLFFLEVDTTYLPTFDVVNPSKKARNALLLWLGNSHNPIAKKIRQVIRFILPDTIRHSINRAIGRLTTKYEKREPMKAKTRAMLCETFREDIHALGHLVNRDLTEWIR